MLDSSRPAPGAMRHHSTVKGNWLPGTARLLVGPRWNWLTTLLSSGKELDIILEILMQVICLRLRMMTLKLDQLSPNKLEALSLHPRIQ